jgi:hypothetical protein
MNLSERTIKALSQLADLERTHMAQEDPSGMRRRWGLQGTIDDHHALPSEIEPESAASSGLEIARDLLANSPFFRHRNS